MFEFDFSAIIDGPFEDRVAKIGATEDEESDEQTTECEVATEGRMAAREPNVIQATK